MEMGRKIGRKRREKKRKAELEPHKLLYFLPHPHSSPVHSVSLGSAQGPGPEPASILAIQQALTFVQCASSRWMLTDNNETTYVSLLHSSPPKTETRHAQLILATKMVRGSEQVSEDYRLPRVHLCVCTKLPLKLAREPERFRRPWCRGGSRGHHAVGSRAGQEHSGRTELGAPALGFKFWWDFRRAAFYMRLCLYWNM